MSIQRQRTNERMSQTVVAGLSQTQIPLPVPTLLVGAGFFFTLPPRSLPPCVLPVP
jgi:hypothetical protein